MRSCAALDILGGTRIAHCITGTIGTNRKDRQPLPQQHPLMRKWLDELTAYNITNDLFLVLDLRRSGWPARTNNFSHDMEAQRALVDRLEEPRHSKRQAAEHDSSVARMLDSLRPVRFISYNEPPLCGRAREARCLCTRAFPSFWEMAAKNDACMDAVETREAELGVRYDWIVKLVSNLRIAVHASARSPVWTHAEHSAAPTHRSAPNPLPHKAYP